MQVIDYVRHEKKSGHAPQNRRKRLPYYQNLMNQKVSIFALHIKLLLFTSNNVLSTWLKQYHSSEPVYFANVEAKEICKEIMTDT